MEDQSGPTDTATASSAVSVSVVTPPVQVERPTVGRRCYYWCGGDNRGLTMIEANQPFDAGVLYVHPMGEDGQHHVNLMVTDHYGATRAVHDVVLLNPDADAHNAVEHGYATWMPYQVKKGTGSS